jgi:hypothetical protein
MGKNTAVDKYITDREIFDLPAPLLQNVRDAIRTMKAEWRDLMHPESSIQLHRVEGYWRRGDDPDGFLEDLRFDPPLIVKCCTKRQDLRLEVVLVTEPDDEEKGVDVFVGYELEFYPLGIPDWLEKLRRKNDVTLSIIVSIFASARNLENQSEDWLASFGWCPMSGAMHPRTLEEATSIAKTRAGITRWKHTTTEVLEERAH